MITIIMIVTIMNIYIYIHMRIHIYIYIYISHLSTYTLFVYASVSLPPCEAYLPFSNMSFLREALCSGPELWSILVFRTFIFSKHATLTKTVLGEPPGDLRTLPWCSLMALDALRMLPRWSQNDPQMTPNWTQNDARLTPNDPCFFCRTHIFERTLSKHRF